MAKWVSRKELSSPYIWMVSSDKKLSTPNRLLQNGISLIPSQQTSLYAMVQLEKRGGWKRGRVKVNTRMGAYTDRVGAGKTFVAISLIHLLKPPRCREFEGWADEDEITYHLALDMPNTTKQFQPWMYSQVVSSVTIDNPVPKLGLNISVVWCPDNCVPQWKSELDRVSIDYWVSPLRITKKISLPKFTRTYTHTNWLSDIGKPSVIIIRPRHIEWWLKSISKSKYVPHRVIIDEADTLGLKTVKHASEEMDFRFLWVVSSTWEQTQKTRYYYTTLDSFRGSPKKQWTDTRWISNDKPGSMGNNVGDRPSWNDVFNVSCEPMYIGECITLPPVFEFRYTVILNKVFRDMTLVNRGLTNAINSGNLQLVLQTLGIEPKGGIGTLWKQVMKMYRTHIQNLEKKLKNAKNDTTTTVVIQQEIADTQRSINRVKEQHKNPICGVCMENPKSYKPRRSRAIVPCCQYLFCTMCVIEALQYRARCPMCNKD